MFILARVVLCNHIGSIFFAVILVQFVFRGHVWFKAGCVRTLVQAVFCIHFASNLGFFGSNFGSSLCLQSLWLRLSFVTIEVDRVGEARQKYMFCITSR